MASGLTLGRRPRIAASLFAVAFSVNLATLPLLLPRLYPHLWDSGPLRARLTSVFYDSRDYGELAENLAAGRGFAVTKENQGLTPTAHWVPGYPLLLAGHLLTLGPSLYGIFALQALLAALIVVSARRLAWALGNARGGTLAAAFLALHPFYLIFSKAVLTDLWFSALFLALVVWAVRLSPTATDTELLLLGCTIGVSALLREVGVILLLPIGFLALSRLARPPLRRITGVSVMVLGCLLLLAPWAARNVRTLGEFIPLTTKTPSLLWKSSVPLPVGVTEETPNVQWPYVPQLVPYARAIEDEVSGLQGTARTRFLVGEALKNYRERPGQGRWAVTKLYMFWRSLFSMRHLGDGKGPVNPLAFTAVVAATVVHWGVLLGAAIGILAAGWRRDFATLWLGLLIGIYWLPHQFLWAEPRYQLPIYPVLVVIATMTVTTFFMGTQEVITSRLGSPAGTAGTTAAVSFEGAAV